MNEATILAELDRIASATKAARDNPTWVVEHHRSGPRLRINCPLWIEGGSSPSGLRLEINMPAASQTLAQDMVAMLFTMIDGRNYHLGRIEFDPSGLGPHHLNKFKVKGASPAITGSHRHPYAENRALGIEALTAHPDMGDLPVAFPLEPPVVTTFDPGVLTIIRKQFDIQELWLEDPQWSRLLT